MSDKGITKQVVDDLAEAHKFVEFMASRADYHKGGTPLWHGWALREAYLAGIQSERGRKRRLRPAPKKHK